MLAILLHNLDAFVEMLLLHATFFRVRKACHFSSDTVLLYPTLLFFPFKLFLCFILKSLPMYSHKTIRIKLIRNKSSVTIHVVLKPVPYYEFHYNELSQSLGLPTGQQISLQREKDIVFE